MANSLGAARKERDRARQQIPYFVEVYVQCPLDVCMGRDPKGVYHKAGQRQATSVPGLQAVYEPPEAPEVIVRGDREAPEVGARRVVATLIEKGYLTG